MKISFRFETLEFQCHFVLRLSKVRELVRAKSKVRKWVNGRKFVTLQYFQSIKYLFFFFLLIKNRSLLALTRSVRNYGGIKWTASSKALNGINTSLVWYKGRYAFIITFLRCSECRLSFSGFHVLPKPFCSVKSRPQLVTAVILRSGIRLFRREM